MKNLFKIFAILVTLSFVIYSCSEDSTSSDDNNNNNNPEPNNYFPYEVGDLYSYMGYNLDGNGDPDYETEYYFNMNYSGTDMIGGKEALVVQIEDTDGNKIEQNQYFYSTTNEIYQFFKLLPELPIEMPLEIPEDWYKTFDTENSEWQLFEQDLQDEEINYNGQTITLKDKFTISVVNEGEQNVEWGVNMENSANAKVFSLEYTYGGNVEYMGIGAQAPFTLTTTNYYVENIGLVKSVTSPLKISVNAFGGEIELLNLPGQETILLSKSVSQ